LAHNGRNPDCLPSTPTAGSQLQPCSDENPMIEPILLTAARVCTLEDQRVLTNASGFFFERGERLFLVTSRHVVVDEPSKHFPDHLEIELHTDPDNLAESTGFSIPLYRRARASGVRGRTRRARSMWR
jgi:hypothetical protein